MTKLSHLRCITGGHLKRESKKFQSLQVHRERKQSQPRIFLGFSRLLSLYNMTSRDHPETWLITIRGY